MLVHRSLRHIALTAAVLVGASQAIAQDASPTAVRTESGLRAADAGYWRAFNACDPAGMGAFIADDIEFYHDRGGVTRSRQALVDSTMKGICGDPDLHVRRAEVPGSVRFDPIPGYGGVLSGEHLFFQTHNGMPEHLTGRATFVALWRYDQGHWTMTRALSLNHRAVP